MNNVKTGKALTYSSNMAFGQNHLYLITLLNTIKRLTDDIIIKLFQEIKKKIINLLDKSYYLFINISYK